MRVTSLSHWIHNFKAYIYIHVYRCIHTSTHRATWHLHGCAHTYKRTSTELSVSPNDNQRNTDQQNELWTAFSLSIFVWKCVFLCVCMRVRVHMYSNCGSSFFLNFFHFLLIFLFNHWWQFYPNNKPSNWNCIMKFV